MESSGPLGTLWTGLGLGGFYLALIWINSLLGLLTAPLFVIPATYLLDKRKKAGASAPTKP